MKTGKRLLLVEDSPDDIALAMRAFERTGLVEDVIVVRDGEEATDFLFRTGAHAGRDPDAMPDMVLLDLSLPKFSGHEVLRRIRADARTRAIPVVVLTSSNEERDVSECYALGANSFIRKPVDFSHFVEALRRLCLYWLVLNQPPASDR